MLLQSQFSLTLPGLAGLGGYGGGLGLGGYGGGLGGYGGLLGIPIIAGGNLIYGGGLGGYGGGNLGLGGYGSLRGGLLRREDRALDDAGTEAMENADDKQETVI